VYTRPSIAGDSLSPFHFFSSLLFFEDQGVCNKLSLQAIAYIYVIFSKAKTLNSTIDIRLTAAA